METVIIRVDGFMLILRKRMKGLGGYHRHLRIFAESERVYFQDDHCLLRLDLSFDF